MQEAEVHVEAVVIRFSPWTSENVLKRAGLAARARGQWTASVFAVLKTEDETDEDVYGRLMAAADLHQLQGNDKFAVCARAGDLLELGFVFMKDGDEDEAPEHYSVRLGDSPTLGDVERFLSAFTKRERRPQ